MVRLTRRRADPTSERTRSVQVAGDDPYRWLFPGEGEHPLHQNSVGYLWRRADDGRGRARVRLHDLRHFYASGSSLPGATW